MHYANVKLTCRARDLQVIVSLLFREKPVLHGGAVVRSRKWPLDKQDFDLLLNTTIPM